MFFPAGGSSRSGWKTSKTQGEPLTLHLLKYIQKSGLMHSQCKRMCRRNWSFMAVHGFNLRNGTECMSVE